MSNVCYGPRSALVKGGSWKSGNCRTSLNLQEDGNLVVYVDGNAKWQAPKAWPNGDYLIMQEDGNFVLYDKDGKPIWHSDTAKASGENRGSSVCVQDDGNVVIYRPDGTPIWHTNTATPIE